MEERYHFDEASYEALAANGISWQSVLDVLRHGAWQLRRHTGAVLQVTTKTSWGSWIGVVLIEEADDEYLVVNARRLTAEEIANIETMLGGSA